MQFSANLGFLWNDRPLTEAIRAAKNAGFHAVECHWPYEVPWQEIKSALDETGLPMLGLNTRRGDEKAGENGLCALPGRQKEARAAIDEALEYANNVNARAVHVMAGFSSGDEAHKIFVENLRFAARKAQEISVNILIEPLNRHDAPGYFLTTTDQARNIIEEVAEPNLKLMFDCYHVGRTEGDLVTRLAKLMPLIGHIQFASVPDRGPPDHGEINYDAVFAELERLNWSNPIGAEYKPVADTESSLSWLL